MTKRCVALMEWNWMGHHPTNFAQITLALEEMGVDVLAICPKPEEASQTLEQLRKSRGLGPSRGGQTVYRQARIPGKRFLGIRPARVSAIDWTLRHFRALEGVVKSWQIESGKQVDLIFYACIYDWDFDWFHTIQRFLTLPWAGLYLHALALRAPGQTVPRTGRPPCSGRIFKGPLCKGVAILDEGRAAQFAESTDKPVVVFPDLTDERLPGEQTGQALGNRLKKFANGRATVGLFGNLQKSKGVAPLVSASQNPRMAETCFAFGGEIWWQSFSPQEAEGFVDVLTNGENIWHHLLRIPDGEPMNFVMSACDVLYAAYMDFPHSSNIMTKAALLKKPLIVSEGYLMAERVRHFRMGEVIPQGNVPALVDAITRITRDPRAWVEANQPRWEDYIREHSFERLQEVLGELLAVEKPVFGTTATAQDRA